MQEHFLHFIYRNKLWIKDSLKLASGEDFEILDTGLQNYNSGPDFFNAKVKIKNNVWAGNVEVHINSSDWFRHKHNKDFAYNNVILHVVFNNDKPVFYPSGEKIPTWEIKFEHIFYNYYSRIKNSDKEIPCSEYIKLAEKQKINIFIESLSIERLSAKTEYVKFLLDKTNNDWEHAFYISLAKNFGFGVNSLPFEQLAFNTPLKIIRKYSGNIFKLEALLFGQANLLNMTSGDIYYNNLLQEYRFLKQKHNLTPIPEGLWKKSKIRPANFPHLRIAQFASLLLNFNGLFSTMIEKDQLHLIQYFFKIPPSKYWEEHYKFGEKTEKNLYKLGNEAFNLIVINTIIPFIYQYGKMYNICSPNNIAIKWLNQMKAENNREIRLWKALNIIPSNSKESQALIHLKNNYCNHKKCLNCVIGFEIIKSFNTI